MNMLWNGFFGGRIKEPLLFESILSLQELKIQFTVSVNYADSAAP
jgi:hypothetical protein